MTFFNLVILFFCVMFVHMKNLKHNNSPLYTEPQFQYIIEKFLHEAKLRNVDVDLTKQKITFKDLKTEIANCYYGVEYIKFINVDRNAWKQMSVEEKESVLFHELGHCALKRIHHDDSLKSDGCPVSLMHRSHSLKNCYFKNRSAYLDELFQQKGN